jgi:glutamate dehydrogenase
MLSGRNRARHDLSILGVKVPKNAIRESIMHVDVDEQTAPELLCEIERGLSQVLNDVRAAVTDCQKTKSRVEEIIEELTHAPPKLPTADV